MTERPGDPVSRLDTLGLWDDTAALPQRLRDALAAGRETFGSHTWDVDTGDPIRSVAAVGLGTGALAADAAAAIAGPHCSLPLWVGTGAPTLPAFVGPESLVLAASCGAGTAAPAAWLTEAWARGSRLAAVCDKGALDAVTSLPPGSALRACALRSADGPVGGIGTFAASVVLLLVALARVGLSVDVASSVDAAAALVERRLDALAKPGGEAEVLARRVGRTIPLVYGAAGVGGVAAHWWKARVNRNAKSPAFWAQVPGLAHDELAGWGQGGDITRQTMTLVLLRQSGESPATRALFDAVTSATDEVMADVIEIAAEGEDDLARFIDLVLLGELVSLHLAAREGVDPGPVPAIDDAVDRSERA